MFERIQDFALLVGHAWRCYECREALIADPKAISIGFKLSEEQRECLSELEDSSFQTVMQLAEATELTVKEIEEAIDHPRARLRHLNSSRGVYRMV